MPFPIFDNLFCACDVAAMHNDPTRDVSLTAEMKAFKTDQIACGPYQSASGVVHADLRLLTWQDRRDEPDISPRFDNPQGPRASLRRTDARQG